ncbi:hypothetical protein TRAPUB_11198 [Trametes pubescens]|uniref:Uncharacterized protein n=1 Tax=Trametes pubescens TaxID=154538 RepID=A0A1M2VXC7_TRAPU|nr:hypothetical protein TRAPUB_11198 [Trametes pubescens]
MVAAAPPEEGAARDGAFCMTVENTIALLSSTVSKPRIGTWGSLEFSLSKTRSANPRAQASEGEEENASEHSRREQ